MFKNLVMQGETVHYKGALISIKSSMKYGNVVHKLIQSERKGNEVNKAMIKALILLYVELGKTDEDLQPVRTKEG